MVQKQFEDGLARFGLKRFSAIGEIFDPNFQEAVAQIESDEPAGTVVQEFQKGYMLGERLLRAAMVVVAKLKEEPKPQPEPEPEPEPEAAEDAGPAPSSDAEAAAGEEGEPDEGAEESEADSDRKGDEAS
mgnify:CR=1 FL=1